MTRASASSPATTRTTAARRSCCATGSRSADWSWRRKSDPRCRGRSSRRRRTPPEDPEIARLKRELLAGIPDDVAERTDEDQARALLADLLEWHRREAKPAWWRYFRRKTLTSAELVDERDAIGELSGGEIVDHVKRSVVRRFSFPPQEHGFGVGDQFATRRLGRRGRSGVSTRSVAPST